MNGRMEDPLTGYVPSRTAVMEDEERDAQERAASYADPPAVQWSANAEKAMAGQEGRLKLRLLVLATSPESCALLRHTLCSGEPLGSVRLPPQPVLEEAELQPKRSTASCQLFALGSEASVASGSGAAVALCDERVPPERAFAWAKAVLSAVAADLTLVEATMPVTEFRGEPADEERSQHFTAATAAAAEAAAAKALPRLPTGNLVAGLPAALLSRLQAGGRQGVLLLNVLPTHLPGRDTLANIAAALRPCLEASGCDAGSLRTLSEKPALAAAAAELHTAWKRSSKYALYL